MPLLLLRIRRVRRVVMRQKPQVMQGFRVHFGRARRPTFVARRTAYRRVEGVVRARPVALGAVEQARRPTGMRHRLQQEGIQSHGRVRGLELLQGRGDGFVEVGVMGGVGKRKALGRFQHRARSRVALIVLNEARAKIVDRIRLGDGGQVLAHIQLNIEVDEELQARPEARLCPAHALGHRAHEAMIAGEQDDDAIGLTKVIGADDHCAVTIVLAHSGLEPEPTQRLRVRLPVLQHLDAQIKVHIVAEQLDDLLAGIAHNATEAQAILALNNALLAGTL